MSMLCIELLGTPKFSIDSKEVPFVRRRSKALIIYLICAERRATRELLADLLWPDSPPSRAMASLRTVLSEIKNHLHGEFLITEGDTVSFDTTNLSCDVLDFKRLLTSNPSLQEMRDAARLWKGGFLKGFSFDASAEFSIWRVQEERNLFSHYKQILQSLYEHEIERGDLDSALEYARSYLSLDSFDEQGHRGVMYIHALRGERKLALQQYERCRTIMEKEFQSPVEEETQTLLERIQSGNLKRQTGTLKNRLDSPRLAILPFRCHAHDHVDVQLFHNMVMEALEDYFAVVPEVGIISRTSTLAYQKSGKRLSIIASELQADYIIEGFYRGDARSLFIEGRLLQTTPDAVVAVKSITVSPCTCNPYLVASYIGESFMHSIGIKHPYEIERKGIEQTQQEKEQGSTLQSKLKLHAKHFLRIDEQEACLKAVELYREAVHLDPDDAEAWAGIGLALQCFCDKGICFPNRTDKLSEVEEAANRALALDEEEPTALTILGSVAIQKDWDFSKAEAFYKRALHLRPNNTRTMRDYAELCIMTGRHEEARRLSDTINALDPVNSHNFKIQFWLHLLAKEFQRADDVVKQHFLLFPSPPLDRILQAHVLLIEGNAEKAIEMLTKIDRNQSLPRSWYFAHLVGEGYGYAVSSRREKALEVIELLKQNDGGSFYPYVPIAQIYTGLGYYDTALTWIDAAVQAHDPGLFFLAVNPLFIPLNNHPGLERILERTHIIPVKF